MIEHFTKLYIQSIILLALTIILLLYFSQLLHNLAPAYISANMLQGIQASKLKGQVKKDYLLEKAEKQ